MLPTQFNLLLPNKAFIPALGLGTYKIKGESAYEITKLAIAQNYRHFDTATIYRNEAALGRAIAESGIPRNEFFITSKLDPKNLSAEGAITTFNASLANLQTTYVDLYLIHWPGRSKLPPDSPQHSISRKLAWSAIEEFYRQGTFQPIHHLFAVSHKYRRRKGKARAIGVSNFTISHLEDLLSSCDIKPHVNQFEFHPRLQQKELIAYCAKHDIFPQPYSPFGQGQLLDHPLIAQVPSLLLGAYGTQRKEEVCSHGTQKAADFLVVIPKASSKERIIENSQVFSFALTDEEMDILDTLDDGTHFAWNPAIFS